MKKKKNVFLDSLNTIKEIRWFIIGIVLLFLAASILGYIFPIFFTDTVMKILQEMITEFTGLSTLQIILKLFFNNLTASFLSFALGIAFGIFPIFAAISNGYLVGYVSNTAVREEGAKILWKLLPHGIFELPAVFISMGLGLWIGISIFEQKDTLRIKFKKGLITFGTIVIPLLIIAAIIEGLLIGFGF